MVGANVVMGLEQQEMVARDSCSVWASEISLSLLLASAGRKLTQTTNHLLLSSGKGGLSFRANTANSGSVCVLLPTVLPLHVCACALYN